MLHPRADSCNCSTAAWKASNWMAERSSRPAWCAQKLAHERVPTLAAGCPALQCIATSLPCPDIFPSLRAVASGVAEGGWQTGPQSRTNLWRKARHAAFVRLNFHGSSRTSAAGHNAPMPYHICHLSEPTGRRVTCPEQSAFVASTRACPAPLLCYCCRYAQSCNFY